MCLGFSLSLSLCGQHGYAAKFTTTAVEHVSRGVQVGRTCVWRKCSMANCHAYTVRAGRRPGGRRRGGGRKREAHETAEQRALRLAGRSSAPTGRIGRHTPLGFLPVRAARTCVYYRSRYIQHKYNVKTMIIFRPGQKIQ